MLFRSTSVIAILAGLGSIPALGADLPSRKGPEIYSAPPLFTWTGFYLGGSIGYIQQNHTTTDIDGTYFTAGDKLPLKGDGGLFSADAGYNYQFGSFVVGGEADIGFSNTSTSNTYYSNQPWALQHSSKLSGMGTVRARFGFAIDRALVYATGGLAFARIMDNVFADPGWGGQRLNISGMRTGWTAGAGMEYAVTDNWTIKAEALYANFGKKSGVTINPSCTGCRYGFKNSVVTARAGVNYKF